MIPRASSRASWTHLKVLELHLVLLGYLEDPLGPTTEPNLNKGAEHHGLRSYNSLNFLCTALCSKNTRASKGLAKYTQSFYYALGIIPCYFGFWGLRGKGDMALQTYLVKGQGWNIKNAINQSFSDRFWWKFACSFLSDLPLRMHIFS